MNQNDLEMANAKAIQANTLAIQRVSGKFGSVLSGITLDLGADAETRFQVIATALSRLGMNVIPDAGSED